jgi:hypothetical protein
MPRIFRTASRFSATLLLTAGLFALTAGADATPFVSDSGDTQDVVIDSLTTTSPDGDTLFYKHVEFTGSTLNKDDIVALLTPGTKREDMVALSRKAKVKHVSIPSVDVTIKKGGTVNLHDITADDVDVGKVGAMAIGGIDVAAKTDQGDLAIKSGAIHLEDIDYSAALAADDAAKAPGPKVGHMSWTALDVIAAEGKDSPGKTMHVSMDSLDARSVYDSGIIKTGTFALKGLTIEPSAGDDLANALSPMGYTRLDIGVTSSMAYDAGTKAFSLDDFTINGAKMGAISITAKLGDIPPAVFSGDKAMMLQSLAGGDVSALEIKFVNAGLVEKGIAFYAAQTGATPEAVKKQWADMAGQLLPAMLGGDPSSLKLAGEIQKFLAQPTSLTIAAHPKAGAVKFMDLMQLADPTAILGVISLTAIANK